MELSKAEFNGVFPLNGKYGYWVKDRVSVHQIYRPFSQYLEPLYVHVFLRDGEVFVVDKYFSASQREGLEKPCQTVQDVIDLVERKGSFSLLYSDWKRKEKWNLSFSEKGFLVDEKPFSASEFESFLKDKLKKCTLVLMDDAERIPSEAKQSQIHFLDEINEAGEGTLYFVVSKTFGGPAEICDRRSASYKPFELSALEKEETKSCITQIEKALVEFMDFVPQLVLLEFEISVSAANEFLIVNISGRPQYHEEFPPAQKLQSFVKPYIERKKKLKAQKAKRSITKRAKIKVKELLKKVRLRLIKKFFPKGLLPYQAVHYVKKNIRDYRTDNGMTFGQKRWAHKNGYLSWRIPQYGITEETKKNYISDFEYRYLRHINNRYIFWLKDKLTPKYTCSDFNDVFPEYYYCTVMSAGKAVAVKMLDCPEGYGTDLEDILRLAKEKKRLAMKPDEGSHGEGFYCLEWHDDSFFLNGNAATEEDVLKVLRKKGNQYLITEYICQHHEIANIYSGSVNTLRLTTFKKNGRDAQVGNAYFRIGSSKTNGVDNIGAGGMMAYVDVETGYFHDAVYLKGNEIISCPVHPDTNVLIQGYIPNWDIAKKKVIEMANSLPELEYFGFDVAITEDGIKMPEINTFPDFPRLDKLTPATMNYLLYKLERKKHMYGYDNNSCNTLFKFQKR